METIERRKCGWMADGVECRNNAVRVVPVVVEARNATVAVCADHSAILDATLEKNTEVAELEDLYRL